VFIFRQKLNIRGQLLITDTPPSGKEKENNKNIISLVKEPLEKLDKGPESLLLLSHK
jgi:hypothetical protein